MVGWVDLVPFGTLPLADRQMDGWMVASASRSGRVHGDITRTNEGEGVSRDGSRPVDLPTKFYLTYTWNVSFKSLPTYLPSDFYFVLSSFFYPTTYITYLT